MNKPVHSYEYIDNHRFEWWNQDFLKLLANRLNLQNVKSLADIGIGLGHWSRLLIPLLSKPVNLVGIDLEEFWIEESKKTFSRLEDGCLSQANFIQSDVHNLSLESNFFDLVTCQTLLMHCHNPQQALGEMKRITKPGGLVLAVEPINLLNRLEFSSVIQALSIETQVAIYCFWSYFHKGIRETRKGNHDIGAYLPGLFKEIGLKNIQVYQNDKVCPLFNPNSINHESLLKEYIKPETAQMILAGGGNNKIISDGINAANLMAEEIIKQINNNYYCKTGFLNTVIVAGVKD